MLTGAGQTIASGAVTVTVKVHVAVLPEASVAVAMTGVAPSEKSEPDAGVELTVAPGQLSETDGAG